MACPEELSIHHVFAEFLSPAASASMTAKTVPICSQGTQSALDKCEREGGRDEERNRGRESEREAGASGTPVIWGE